jgi:hypothetical protein
VLVSYSLEEYYHSSQTGQYAAVDGEHKTSDFRFMASVFCFQHISSSDSEHLELYHLHQCTHKKCDVLDNHMLGHVYDNIALKNVLQKRDNRPNNCNTFPMSSDFTDVLYFR